ncbi:MAG: VWA domain-containing protein [Clostridium sp.]|nr:VWA domain-containing protein [Clostridium sp.]
MKKGIRRLCLLAAAIAAAGMLGGCGAGGSRQLAEATAAGPAPGAYAEAPETAAGEMNGVDGSTAMNRMSDMGDGRPEAVHNTEEYSYNPENPFTSVANAPLSTFGADVDTASYANIRRMILAGNQVPEDAVRIEEMLNYFYYDYPEPQGEEPFSVTTRISQCPWNENHDLLQIGLQAENVDEDRMPKSNLVFLLDVSGSMEGPLRLDLVKRAFLMLTENLKPQDTVSIVTYASSDQVVLDGASGEDKTDIMTAIENLSAGGSTAGSKGIETAYELAEKHFIRGGNNRVILATDGDLNVGVTSEGELTRLIERKKESGVFLSVLGFGTGNIKDNKMEALADHGNGQYAYVDSIMEARKALVQEMGGTLFTVAKDVKFQVEFNPARVKGYRLIGYENRIMAHRDFDDDTKDGGEIGAGHRVTALYELIPADSDEDMGEVELKYQTSGGEPEDTGANAFDEEWMNVKIRYKEPEEDESRLLEYPVKDEHFHVEMPEDMAFAASVAETGMLLRKSEYAGDASYGNVIRRLEGMERVREDAYSQEFLYLVRRMEKLK